MTYIHIPLLASLLPQETKSVELDSVLSFVATRGDDMLIVLNKVDVFAQDIKQKIGKDIAINKVVHRWSRLYPNATILPVSAWTVSVSPLVLFNIFDSNHVLGFRH